MVERYKFQPIAWRRTQFNWTRTLEDDTRDDPRPVNVTPHAHFHFHGGSMHAHDHVHPEPHAHSARRDEPAHEVRNA